MTRLPVVGSDDGTWGTVLNDFLGVAHNADGTLIHGSVASALNNVSVQTSTYAPSSSQSEIVLANATGGGFTITLPSAVSNTNSYTVKKTDSSSNGVTIASSSGTIDGGSTAILYVQYAAITAISDGTNWNII